MIKQRSTSEQRSPRFVDSRFTFSNTSCISGVWYACTCGSSDVIMWSIFWNSGESKSCMSCIGLYLMPASLFLSCHLRHRGFWYHSSHLMTLSRSSDLQSRVRENRGCFIMSTVSIPGAQLSPK